MPNLADLSTYIYGTTRLGDDAIPFSDRVKIAHAAMHAGVWFHTSHQYGDALQVLRTAFDQDRAHVPSVIFKIGWESAEQIEEQIRLQTNALDIPSMSIGQLCLGGQMAEDLANGGAGLEQLNRLKELGIVGRYVLEIFPWTSETAVLALKNGHLGKLVDGLIFYLNPLQRFATNELWDLAREQRVPIIAMRTVAGGDVHQLATSESAPAYLRERATQVAPLFERSGCKSWAEFCFRYVFCFPDVRATVGATSRPENLKQFIACSTHASKLPYDVHEELVALQRKWSDEYDSHAEPWSM